MICKKNLNDYNRVRKFTLAEGGERKGADTADYYLYGNCNVGYLSGKRFHTLLNDIANDCIGINDTCR